MSSDTDDLIANASLIPSEAPQSVSDVADPVKTAAVVAKYSFHPDLAPEDNSTSIAPEDPEQFVLCNERDVLMGRGKRISEWPGNQRFRKIVARYRPEYLSSARSAKIHVAKQVIAEVVADGGRFLRELDPGNTGIVAWSKWLPVAMDRCIEKTCQALREKEKSMKPKVRPPAHEDVMPYDTKKLRSRANDEQFFQRLVAFREKHGHTAVPPGWEHDLDLADWTTVQRQVFRDLKLGNMFELTHHHHGHNLGGEFEEEKTQGELILETNETLPGATITEQQQQLVDKLRGIGFCVDYEEWHWEHSFKLYLQGDLVMKRLWLRQQRRDHREGVLTKERRERLTAAGVNLVVAIGPDKATTAIL